ncbi:MAG: hypothetical protein PHU25_08750 [Deltaproteobacteria bacterium]|nr:hypothetical protein [Deltaproteobacteria bacterium]
MRHDPRTPGVKPAPTPTRWQTRDVGGKMSVADVAAKVGGSSIRQVPASTNVEGFGKVETTATQGREWGFYATENKDKEIEMFLVAGKWEDEHGGWTLSKELQSSALGRIQESGNTLLLEGHTHPQGGLPTWKSDYVGANWWDTRGWGNVRNITIDASGGNRWWEYNYTP